MDLAQFSAAISIYRGAAADLPPPLCRHVGLTETHELDMVQLRSLVGPRTKLVATYHMSNVTGAVRPCGRRVRTCARVGLLH